MLDAGEEWQEVYCEGGEYALRMEYPARETLVVQVMDRAGQVYGEPMQVSLSDFKLGLANASYALLNRTDEEL